MASKPVFQVPRHVPTTVANVPSNVLLALFIYSYVTSKARPEVVAVYACLAIVCLAKAVEILDVRGV